ncbi:hypothetical protein BRADI_2g57050v3 [Brachypodium distachyon]|uniref:Uncharacterized protein n=1 Tax=Brachypodium distachyon TaxID=15368 RepID=A0A0Q3IYY3_BRADI|nr:hypothetical protein BRADI_2g57050v3 [Brachypodium distachyon]
MAGAGRRAAVAVCGRWCLVILAVASALGVSGPALYWRYKKGFSSSVSAAAVSSPSCPPCTCDCPPPLSLRSIAPGLMNFSISACGTNDPERSKEMEKQFVDLLNSHALIFFYQNTIGYKLKITCLGAKEIGVN